MKEIKIFFIVGLFISTNLCSQNIPTKSYEGSYLFQGTYPSGLHNKDWFPDDYEVQGVTNDGKNWFFTITDQDKTHGIMWRIPKEVDLGGDVIGNPGAISVHYDNVDELNSKGLWHWGDPDHIEYEGIDYILVPIYGGKQRVVACFSADDLSFKNYAIFDDFISAGWCAIGIDNKIYASEDDPSVIYSYSVDWSSLTNENAGPITLSSPEPNLLTKPNGSTLSMTDMQGGEFSTSGEMLYLVSGRCLCAGNGAAWSENDGIHAIETNTWTQLNQSLKNSKPTNYFSYDYNSSCTECVMPFPPFFILPVGCHTPEGLTFWDLEGGNVQGVTGSLHVLIDFYTAIEIGASACDEDKLIMHHYSANIYIDKNSNGGSGLTGILSNPFQTVSDAYGDYIYEIWDGAQLIIEAGTYNDTGTYDKRIRITSKNGSVIIGQQ